MARSVEIAGAGIAGLAAAAALARRGWRVTVHERATDLRTGGFGITLFGNGLRVLRELGALEAATRGAVQIAGLENYDPSGRLLARQALRRPGSAVRIARARLVEALAASARCAGAELRFGGAVRAADPTGAVILADGARRPADLVLVADGIGSAARAPLDLAARVVELPEGATRLLIPRREGDFRADGAGFVQEWWAGRRRMLFSAVSPEEAYVTLVCPVTDDAGRRIPIDLESWQRAIPPMAPVLARVAAEANWRAAHWEQFRMLRLSSWSRGRAAVLGDAAHAMPPNLGQGGGCALMNALGLAVALDEAPGIEAALAAWEARERPLTEHTQRWSRLVGALVPWPRPLRGLALAAAARLPAVREAMQRAANHLPTGADPNWAPA